jgi:RHS repeat-associated protein
MLRTPSAVSARTLTHHLRTRPHARPRPTPAAKHRLDTLEAREQPGSVMSGLAAGLAGGGMLEPLAIMAAVVGTNALSKEPVKPDTAAVNCEKPTSPMESPDPARPVTVSKPASGGTTDGSMDTTAASNNTPAIDVSDLSIGDPSPFNPPALDSAGAGDSGGSGSPAVGPVSSGLAGESPADHPNQAGRQAGGPSDSGPSIAAPAPVGAAAGPKSIAAGTSAPAAPKAMQTFVNPPNDRQALEPPAPTQVRTASIPTSTNPLFAVGTDAGVPAQVKVYDAQTQALKFTLSPFPNSFTGGARVAVADVTGDGTSDIVVGEGPGGNNLVRVYNGTNGHALTGTLGSFSAFPTSQASGVWVAADDVTGDGKADIVVGTDGSFAPQVKIFSGANGTLVRTQDVSKLGLTGGVRVAAGDLNGDGKAEVIVGSGPGAAARVGAFDGANGKVLYDYLPFGAGYFGGVNLSAGDVNGDGYADAVVGQASGGEQVKVYDGRNTGSVTNLDPFPGTTGGVRVGVVDADADGVLDVLAGRGPGGGEVRGYNAADASQLFSLTPFGAGFTNGTFVAGDPRPVSAFHTLATKPTVTIAGSTTAVFRPGSFSVTLTRDDTSTGLMVGLSFGGDLGYTHDYSGPSGTFMSAGQATATLNYSVVPDSGSNPGGKTIVIGIMTSANYNVGSPGSATVLAADSSVPAPAAPAAYASNGCTDNSGNAPGTPANVAMPYNPATDPGGINEAMPAYAPVDPNSELGKALANINGNGTKTVSTCPTSFSEGKWTDAFGTSIGVGGNNRLGYGDLPELVVNGNLTYIVHCDWAEYFDQSGGNYTGRDGDPNTLTHDGTNKQFVYTDSTGAQVVFHDYDSSIPAIQRGQVKAEKDAAGNTVTSATYNGSGQLTSLARSVTTGGTTTTDTWGYTFLSSGPNSGKISNVTLTETIGGGSPVTVRSADLAYYDGTTANGTLGDLATFTVKDPGGNQLEVHYYRYYTSNTSPGYTGGLKFQVTGAAYDRMAAWAAANSTTVAAMTDAQVAPFANLYLEFDAVHRVARADVGAGGCSACSGGIGSYTYSFATSSFPVGYNAWRTKRTETAPDGSVNVTYFNYVNEPMLYVHQEGGQSWETFWKYDTSGNLVLAADPSAVSGYDDTYADLLHNQSGNYQYLRDAQGLITTDSYYSSTTATSTTAGGVASYLYQSAIQRGETGTSVLQGTTDYISRTANSITVYPVADATVYRNDNGTGGQTTSYAWTWNTGSDRPASVTVTLPTVTTGQNGPGTATSTTQVFDTYGRLAWTKDAGGFINYFAYDDATGALVKTIQDVDTTQTSTFTNLPSGWSTPTGGGLHLTTTHEVDTLGRTTKETSPAGNVTFIVYIDSSAPEVRVYPSWDSTNNVPTGPTQVYREDRAREYTETLTMSATPTVSGGRPTGAESISNVQSLFRNVLNDAGQVVYADQYISLAGTSYSQSSVTLGTSGTNYLRTQYSYDHLGRLNRTVTPTGTIYRTVTDGQGRVVSTWVGTNDTPGSGFWSPTNNTSPSNMVVVSENEYDAGGVGDGLLTKTTEHPGGSAADRVTAMSYDWRDRQVASKSGVETSESTSLNRPIVYQVYDNLNEVTEADQFDGDGLSITTDANGDGVPDQPSSSALRAKSTAAFDELGRAYQEKTFSVDPSSGSVSTNALTTNHWFDARSNEIKTSNPGGEVDKAVFDGAGRETTSYVTDGGGDSAYADAATVTGDAVLEQVETAYDADSNPILTTTRERFHDETATGALGNPTTAPKARVSYQAGYFDRADRLTDSVDVGTNGGSAYTRPSSVPSRSDTVLVTNYGYNAAGWTESVTDPKGLVGKTFYDLAGRTVKTVENYVDGTVSDADDKTVEFTFNGNGQNVNTSADLTGGGQQTTANVYGVGTGSDLVSNDLVAAVEYPDPSTGNPSSSSEDTYTYNRLGQVKTKTDRNGTVHTYSYDVLGRVVSDAITTLGSGVDGAVRRIETAYDGQGNVYLITSYDAASGGNVVNQVQRAFNGLGQLIQEWQATSGAVNIGTTPSVQYAYSFAPSGSTNHSRLTSITYPNGRVVTYNYATGLADTISRLSSITDGAITLESYDYLGLGTVVKRAHPETGVDLTYEKLTGESNGDAGDQYTGLDRFGRVDDQRWTTSGGAAADRRQYGFDRDSNRLYMNNLVSTSNSELYSYDGLNQLLTFQRGTLNGTKDGLTGSASRSQSWDLDAVGNFDSQTTDGTAQTRAANKQNEITSVSGATTPAYDANGNMTGDETGRTFKYDAWNRLVEVRDSGNNLLATYRYDALGRRVRETRGGTTTDLYYSSEWQVLEERVGGAPSASYVWSPVYVDALIARDRDTNGDGTLDERLYAIQDANWDVVALVNTSGTVVERYAYDAYGVFTVMDGSWGSRAGSSYGWQYLFQGGRLDSDGRLYSFRIRWYSPTLGRWFQMDPLMFVDTSNLYSFERDNPANRLDPFGTDSRQDPLTPKELEELRILMEGYIKLQGKIKASDKQVLKLYDRMCELQARLRNFGVKFSGYADLENLKKLIEVIDKAAGKIKGNDVLEKIFGKECDWLTKAIETAITGLQKIEDEKYEQYKRAREGGQTHERACTFHDPSQPQLCDWYKMRYELEHRVEPGRPSPPPSVMYPRHPGYYPKR